MMHALRIQGIRSAHRACAALFRPSKTCLEYGEMETLLLASTARDSATWSVPVHIVQHRTFHGAADSELEKVLQEVSKDHTFFHIMGMKEGAFKLNNALLDSQYKQLQRKLHPDKFATRPQAERERSEDASALVNEAFNTLKHPLKRAEYILRQKGIDSGEGTVDDPELLMGVMEARESVEAAENEEELQKFGATFQQQADDCIQGLEQAFSRDDLQRAQELTTLLRYITRVQAAILEKL